MTSFNDGRMAASTSMHFLMLCICVKDNCEGRLSSPFITPGELQRAS